MLHRGYYLASQSLLKHLRENQLLQEVPIVERSGCLTTYLVADGYLGLPIYEATFLPCEPSILPTRVPNPTIEPSEYPFNPLQGRMDWRSSSELAIVHLIRIRET